MADYNAGWEYSSLTWEIRQEQLAPNRWLSCFRRPQSHTGIRPNHWIYVFDKKFEGIGEMRKQIDFVCIEELDPILAECAAHEMRKKYGTNKYVSP
jgi:hypothetical protein